ncbi:MAG: hypothetical protein ACRENP_19445 [Longimicrobiales bacterium]
MVIRTSSRVENYVGLASAVALVMTVVPARFGAAQKAGVQPCATSGPRWSAISRCSASGHVALQHEPFPHLLVLARRPTGVSR